MKLYRLFFCVLGLMVVVGVSAQSTDITATQLKGTKGTYAFPPCLSDGRVDNKKLIQQLKELHANTYHWLAWGATSDIEAFKKFLPMAKKAKIKVWITLVPPSESPPLAHDYSEPYRLDFKKWAEEIAKLSLIHSNLVAWSIDDFVHNLKIFTPEYVGDFLRTANEINPKLSFIPCCYYKQINAAFVKNYKHLLNGILFPYRNESISANLKDAGQAKYEIEQLRSLFGGNISIFIDIYASAHSSLGASTPEYVRDVLNTGLDYADGVLIYCHQNPVKDPEKYAIIKEGFGKKRIQ